jgi:tRNA pseudouridine38-40 synthase
MQKNAVSVQQVIQDSLSKVLREKVEITGSGRTDTGVHATHQVFHLDTSKNLGDNAVFKFNSILPPDISIREIRRVREDSHARFDAVSRSYRYQVLRFRDPFLTDRSYLFTQPLNLEIMDQASQIIKDRKDFECFSRVKTDVNHFLCEISESHWTSHNDLLHFHVSSNRFLRGMIRSMVGTLLDIGTGKKDLTDLRKILDSRDRTQAGRSVPARGLYLCNVVYPDEIFLKN